MDPALYEVSLVPQVKSGVEALRKQQEFPEGGVRCRLVMGRDGEEMKGLEHDPSLSERKCPEV